MKVATHTQEFTPAEISGVILTGDPQSKVAEIARDTGFWRCTPGSFVWHYNCDEMIYIIEGRAALRDEKDQREDIGPGSAVYFVSGSWVKWEVSEPVLKFFVLKPTAKELVMSKAKRAVENILGSFFIRIKLWWLAFPAGVGAAYLLADFL